MWKKFNFFTAELLQSADPGSPLFAIQALDISCVTSGKGYIVFGDAEGGITLSDQEFSLRRFIAHDTIVNHAYQYKSSNILLTIGDGLEAREKEAREVSHTLGGRFRKNFQSNEEYKWMLDDLHINAALEDSFPTKNATLKLWLMDKLDENGVPLCIRSFKLFEKVEEEIITSLAVDEKNNFIAFGCQSGNICLVSGDLSRSKKLNLSILPKQFNAPITNLYFAEDSQDAQMAPLFVTTAGQVGCYRIPCENKRTIEYVLLDEHAGCGYRCACVNHKDVFVVARTEGLFTYLPTTASTSYLLEGAKSCLFAYRDCLVVSRQGPDHKTWAVNVLNIENGCDEYELIASRNGINEPTSWMWKEWGMLFIMTEGHIVYLLREKDTASKLQILYDRQLYPLALALCKEWGLLEHDLCEVHQQYADWLYDQGEQENAMNEYIQTIPYADASYIIRRYLEASQIHMLINYLENLHQAGVACTEQTMLLINSYTKLHDQKKLRQLVEGHFQATYDPQVAGNALVEAGFHAEACRLAERHHLHEMYISVQIEKAKAPLNALTYLEGIASSAAAKALARFGKKLVDLVPERTTALLIRLCEQGEKPQLFIAFFVDNPRLMKRFLLSVTQRPQSDPLIWNNLLELTLRPDLLTEEENAQRDQTVLELLKHPEAKYETDEALVLLQRYHCEAGLVYVYERLHMQSMLLQQYYGMGEHGKALELCKLHGKADPSLWEYLLRMVGESKEVEEAEMEEVILAVDRSNQLPLLRVIQLLGDNAKIPGELIKDLVKKQLRLERSIREVDERKQVQLEEQIATSESKYVDLQTHGFAFHQTRCVACGLSLEQPVVHFFCGHSFHKACLDLQKETCPRCEVQHEEREKRIDDGSFMNLVSALNMF